MSEAAFGAQAVNCGGQEVGTQVERAHDERCRPEVPGRLGVSAALRRSGPQACQHAWRMAERIGVGMDRDHARVVRVGATKAMRRLAE
jgi:hypothetical protein